MLRIFYIIKYKKWKPFWALFYSKPYIFLLNFRTEIVGKMQNFRKIPVFHFVVDFYYIIPVLQWPSRKKIIKTHFRPKDDEKKKNKKR